MALRQEEQLDCGRFLRAETGGHGDRCGGRDSDRTKGVAEPDHVGNRRNRVHWDVPVWSPIPGDCARGGASGLIGGELWPARFVVVSPGEGNKNDSVLVLGSGIAGLLYQLAP